MSRFERIGVNYRFSPQEVDLRLDFSRPEQKAASWEVAVSRRSKGHLFTRRINLLTSPTKTGNTKSLIEEIAEVGVGDAKQLAKLMLEACESVLASHRNGHASVTLSGPMVRPDGPLWLCQGLLMKDKPNCWLGAASTGKSTLAVAVCAYYATGFRFCDRETEQGVPMFLDWEEDEQTFRQMAFDVCRNLGVTEWPRMVYINMHGQRLRDRIEAVAREIHDQHVGLVVLDAVAAMGAVPDEHVTYEMIGLEMSDCLDSLPAVTVLALDHVTGEEFRDQQRIKPLGRRFIPNKGRGSVRKVEYFRNQWTLMPDIAAEECGRHVVNWHHTKINRGAKERLGFATEILHFEQEISVMVRPLQVQAEPEVELSDADQVLQKLAEAAGQTPHEVAWRADGKPPDPRREGNVRRILDRAVQRGLVRKAGRPVRYWIVSDNDPEQGVLIRFPEGGA